VLAGSRVTVSLDALSMGASPFTVGALIAVRTAADALRRTAPLVRPRRRAAPDALRHGGHRDRGGAPRGLRWIAGAVRERRDRRRGFMAFQVAAQNATGGLAARQRARNFSRWRWAIRFRASSDRWQRDSASTTSASPRPSRCWRSSRSCRSRRSQAAGLRSRPHPRASGAHHGGVRALLRHKTLRRVLAINAFFAIGWDLHTVFVPIYGAEIG
jgi:hypothetical protein